MLAKRIIPCLDIKDGRVVKGTNFVNLRDAGDPIELAKEYDKQGADEVVFLDITASSDKRGILLDLIKRCAKELFIPFTVGGGINDIKMIHDCLHAGADKISINTAAVKHPLLIKEAHETFGAQCIVAAVDIKKIEKSKTFKSYPIKNVQCDSTSIWEVFTHGGRQDTGIDAIKWIKLLETYGAGELLLTSMDADGSKEGYDYPITEVASKETKIPIIASGGAGTLNHISDILTVADAALLASMLHYKETTVQEIKQHCRDKHIMTRI